MLQHIVVEGTGHLEALRLQLILRGLGGLGWSYQLPGLSCPAGSIARNVLIGGRWGGVYPGLRGWKVERMVIMVLKLFTLSKTILRSAYFFRTRLDWARWDSSLVQGPTRSSGFILYKEKRHFINQCNLNPPPLNTQQSHCTKEKFSKILSSATMKTPWKAAWGLDMVSGHVGSKFSSGL